MQYRVQTGEGQGVDAHFEIDSEDILFHSRRGGDRNTEYALGLRVLLQQLVAADFRLLDVLVDTQSARVQVLSEDERRVLDQNEAWPNVEEMFALISSRMRGVGRSPDAKPGGGNPTRRIRLRFVKKRPAREILRALRIQPDGASLLKTGRLPAEELRKVRPEHVWGAVEDMLEGRRDNAYEEPRKFELVTDEGVSLPPKEVFGIAVSHALGYRVRPEHFTGGEDTICFELLRNAGFMIRQFGVQHVDSPIPPVPEDKEWREGNRKLVRHYRRERARGLTKAKKDSFVAEHGHLFCEKCGFRPAEKYGDSGHACIEVHHEEIAVADMNADHRTKLEDLVCLCANCHRVEHYRIQNGS